MNTKIIRDKDNNHIGYKYKKLWENNPEDDIYSFDIHVWRKPGMGNSVQTVTGNKVSIMTGLTSLFHTLLTKEVLSLTDLIDMANMASLSEEELNVGLEEKEGNNELSN